MLGVDGPTVRRFLQDENAGREFVPTRFADEAHCVALCGTAGEHVRAVPSIAVARVQLHHRSLRPPPYPFVRYCMASLYFVCRSRSASHLH